MVAVGWFLWVFFFLAKRHLHQKTVPTSYTKKKYAIYDCAARDLRFPPGTMNARVTNNLEDKELQVCWH